MFRITVSGFHIVEQGVAGTHRESARRSIEMPPQTLAEKVWERHVVHRADGEPDLLYVDLHLVHEVTSPQAFDGLRLAGRPVRRPDLTLATEELACWRGWLSVLLHPRESKFALDRAHQKMRRRLRIWSNSNRYGSATSLFAAMITMSWEKMEALYQLKPPSRTT
jgi:hypothetical protein